MNKNKTEGIALFTITVMLASLIGAATTATMSLAPTNVMASTQEGNGNGDNKNGNNNGNGNNKKNDEDDSGGAANGDGGDDDNGDDNGDDENAPRHTAERVLVVNGDEKHVQEQESDDNSANPSTKQSKVTTVHEVNTDKNNDDDGDGPAITLNRVEKITTSDGEIVIEGTKSSGMNSINAASEQTITQATDCGNGELPLNVFCQNIGSYQP